MIDWNRRAADWLAGYFQASFVEGEVVPLRRDDLEEQYLGYMNSDGSLPEEERRLAIQSFRTVFMAVSALFGMPAGSEN